MHTKMCIHYSTKDLLASYKVCLYFLLLYRIASNYGRSRINAWSHLVAGGNSIITKINAGSQINAGSRINAGSFVGP